MIRSVEAGASPPVCIAKKKLSFELVKIFKLVKVREVK